jgi:hypothetical protein
MIDPAAPKHVKRLITVPEEAKVLQDAVTDVLDRGISLRAVAADLRGRGLRTVTGKPFSAVSLRDALLASHAGTSCQRSKTAVGGSLLGSYQRWRTRCMCRCRRCLARLALRAQR